MLSNSSISNSKEMDGAKKLAVKFLWFTPLALILLLDSFLPIDFFNHRVWESLVVMRPNQVLAGYFYPQIRLVKHEAASDLDYYNGQPVRKTNEWVTDRYGFRKQEPYPLPTVMVIGDSNVAGSGLTQKTLFTEVLQERLQTGVYPLAPGGIESLFYSTVAQKFPPKIVILSLIERNLTTFGPYVMPSREPFFKKKIFLEWKLRWQDLLLSNPLIVKAAIFVDRFFYKKTLAQYVKARVFQRRKWGIPSAPKNDLPEMLFFQGDLANRDFPDAVLQSTVDAVLSYKKAVESLDARFIYMPIPNKENIYYDALPGKTPPVFLKKLIVALRERGVEVVDLDTAYHDFRRANPGTLLYDVEEAHWNPAGVQTAAEAVVNHLKSHPGK